eukprot:gnl/TRDRNA2_/TRDRNA2_128787_c0_seq2.p1 gnl/TRDRNA2_/TRDRNA2_128787_c0~~gnl/TRDRNA2_/TRDRNA2_128787_c0_seq2.p1  ORF type:complete len:515 (+),score=53.50 gnl/TRDRNA2_/TRDRNA2_128787_c0_seq2:79-1545(+)
MGPRRDSSCTPAMSKPRMLRVEFKGEPFDWLDLDDLGDAVQAPDFTHTLRENIAHYFGVPFDCQAIYDEDGVLSTTVDFSRALKSIRPNLRVYDVRAMESHLKESTAQMLAAIASEVIRYQECLRPPQSIYGTEPQAHLQPPLGLGGFMQPLPTASLSTIPALPNTSWSQSQSASMLFGAGTPPVGAPGPGGHPPWGSGSAGTPPVMPPHGPPPPRLQRGSAAQGPGPPEFMPYPPMQPWGAGPMPLLPPTQPIAGAQGPPPMYPSHQQAMSGSRGHGPIPQAAAPGANGRQSLQPQAVAPDGGMPKYLSAALPAPSLQGRPSGPRTSVPDIEVEVTALPAVPPPQLTPGSRPSSVAAPVSQQHDVVLPEPFVLPEPSANSKRQEWQDPYREALDVVEVKLVKDAMQGAQRFGFANVPTKDGLALIISWIDDDGLLGRWNQTHRDKRVNEGDRIVAVNAVSDSVKEMRAQLQSSAITLIVHRRGSASC